MSTAARRLFRFALLSAALLATALPAGARERGQPGVFDYYVLSLSWSPAFCAAPDRDDTVPEQCGAGRRYGFIVHGLWPQYEAGGYPEFCARAQRVPAAAAEATLAVMPSPKLIEHQWRKHGICTGMDADAYFSGLRSAFARITVPDALKAPESPVTLSVAEIERRFAEANPGLDAESLAVICKGRFVSEVRICLTRDFAFRYCGPDVRDRCRGDATFRPLR